MYPGEIQLYFSLSKPVHAQIKKFWPDKEKWPAQPDLLLGTISSLH
jgi:hypothetical protein